MKATGLTPLLLLLLAAPATAHRLAPSYLELSEGPRSVQVLWKTPRLRALGAPLDPLLPEHCPRLSEPRVEDQGTARLERWTIDCGESGLVGARVGATGLDESGTDVLVHATLADGRVVRSLLSSGSPELRIPARERRGDVVRAYGSLGVEHLLTGFDHLLFVAGIALLLRGRRLLAAVTGFTAGHCVTLALASLGALSVPRGLVEVGIAASLVVLGLELAGASRRGPISRRPMLAASGFGLLHGLGFATALTELGLPSGSVPLALFSFNAGIEIGQLTLIAGLLPGLWALEHARVRWPRLAIEAPATAIGSLGVFFLLERAARLL